MKAVFRQFGDKNLEVVTERLDFRGDACVCVNEECREYEWPQDYFSFHFTDGWHCKRCGEKALEVIIKPPTPEELGHT